MVMVFTIRVPATKDAMRFEAREAGCDWLGTLEKFAIGCLIFRRTLSAAFVGLQTL